MSFLRAYLEKKKRTNRKERKGKKIDDVGRTDWINICSKLDPANGQVSEGFYFVSLGNVTVVACTYTVCMYTYIYGIYKVSL